MARPELTLPTAGVEVIYVVAYDIADDRRREAVALALSSCGARSSSASSSATSTGNASRAQSTSVGADRPHEDQIRLYALPNTPGKALDILGSRRLEERDDFWII